MKCGTFSRATSFRQAQWQRRDPHRAHVRNPTTSTLMYGHMETPGTLGHPTYGCSARYRDETGGFTEFVPLGFVHQNTLLVSTRISAHRTHARPNISKSTRCRVLLAGSIDKFKSRGSNSNRKLSQLCLHAGANDYGGTLMEENISREAGATAGQYTSPEDFQALILGIGRVPSRAQHKVFANAD